MFFFYFVLSVGCLIGWNSVDAVCDPEWQYYNGHCYWSSLYQQSNANHKDNWFKAQIECRKRSSDLVSIHSDGENHFVYKMTRCSNTWNGLVMADKATGNTHNAWGWINAEHRDYINWASGHPRIDSGWDSYACSFVAPSYGQKWMQARCAFEKLHYVCRKQAVGLAGGSVNVTVHHKVQGKCNKGWYQFGSKCYLVNNTKVDFFASLLHCQALKSQVVTLHNTKDNADLTRVFDQCETPWIGLENVDPNNVHKNSGWKWNDNTDVDYSNWENNVPTNDKTKQCVTLEAGSIWNNRNCWELHPFVCETTIPDTA